MLAITAGQSDFLRDRLIDVSPHLLVLPSRLHPVTRQNLLEGREDGVIELSVNVPPNTRQELKPYTEILARIEKASDQIVAVAPYVIVQGVFRKGIRYRTVAAHGIDPAREREIARLDRSIREGMLATLGRTPNGAVIGRGLARRLGIRVGDDFSFVTPSGSVQPLKVVAIFESGVASFDDGRGYINLALAQTLRGMPRNSVTGLSVQLRDIDRAAEVKGLVEAAGGYRVETWEETNAGVLGFQDRQGITSRILVIFVFVTAAFGIANTLVAIVLQKRHDIAVMKSYGATRGGIAKVFMLEGALIGVIGGAIGAAAGYGLARLVASLNLMPPSDTAYIRFDTFPVSLDYRFFLITFAMAVVMAVAASLLPARRAARLAPVRTIRGE
jgi:lipoprotein-releasing system permease protein